MSFDWNLSSSSEGEDDALDGTRFQSLLDAVQHQAPPAAAALRNTDNGGQEECFDQLRTAQDAEDDDDDDDDDDSEVDWEDATEEQVQPTNDPAAKTSLRPHHLQPVTVNLGEKQDPMTTHKKRKRPKRRKTKYRLESLPHDMQSLLWNLHRTHLLAWTSRAVGLSRQASDPDVLAVAFSLIPDRFSSVASTTEPPTLAQLHQLAAWYFDWVHHVRERRERQYHANVAAGAPRNRPRRRRRRGKVPKIPSATVRQSNNDSEKIPSKSRLLALADYLSATNDDDPQLAAQEEESSFAMTSLEILVLLLAMTRSLGWRTRWVQAVDAVPLDLTVDHPMFLLSTPLFASAAKKPSRTSRHEKVDDIVTNEDSGSSSGELNWMEVWCRESSVKNKSKKAHRWIHVDPVRKLVNQPHKVEVIWKQQKQKQQQKQQQLLSGQANNNSTTSGRRGSKIQQKGLALAYAVAIEHASSATDVTDIPVRMRLTDVTPRYAASWIESLRKRGIVRGKTSLQKNGTAGKDTWWPETVKAINQFSKRKQHESRGATAETAICLDHADGDDDDDNGDKKPAAVNTTKPNHVTINGHEYDDHDEAQELQTLAGKEAIPTSKAAFQSHPMYVIPSLLGVAEVLAPDANKHVCGVFKGELVYKRTDVSTARPDRKWPYYGRKVKAGAKPIKKVKTRKKPTSQDFRPLRSYGVGKSNDGSEERRHQDIQDACQPLEDGMEDLFAIWQTVPWSPSPVGPNDPIPVNEFKNVELELLNPGLIHIDVRGAAAVAKKLSIPYAPCLLGFEGHGGNRTPTIRGIVVHQHNQEIVQAATNEVTNFEIATEQESRRKAVLLRWKKLMVGLLTKDRLEREYGGDEEQENVH